MQQLYGGNQKADGDVDELGNELPPTEKNADDAASVKRTHR